MHNPILSLARGPREPWKKAPIEAWRQDCWVLAEQDLGADLRRVRVFAPGSAPSLHGLIDPQSDPVADEDEDELSLLAVLVSLGGASPPARPRLPVAAGSARALLPVVQALAASTTDGFRLWWLREAQRTLRAADGGASMTDNVVPLRRAVSEDHDPCEDPLFQSICGPRRAVARAIVEGLLRPVGGGLEVMTVPVSNALFELMDPSHLHRRALPSEGAPATNLSWYEASLFAEWVGLRLPRWEERSSLTAPMRQAAFAVRALPEGHYEWCQDEAPCATAGLGLPLPDRLGVHEDTRRLIADARTADAPVVAHPADRAPVIGLRLVRDAVAQRVTTDLRAVS
ncbi:hypothetical protein L6R49_16935 [Myxococcota bacterium]|nr:hypothetical protein [Myxococcota bacterium]